MGITDIARPSKWIGLVLLGILYIDPYQKIGKCHQPIIAKNIRPYYYTFSCVYTSDREGENLETRLFLRNAHQE